MSRLSPRVQRAVCSREGLRRGERGDVDCAYCDITGSVLWAQNNRIYSTTDNGVWLSIDHVVPVALGGDDELTNLEWACQDCNRRKGARGDWTSPNRYLVNGERRRAVA